MAVQELVLIGSATTLAGVKATIRQLVKLVDPSLDVLGLELGSKADPRYRADGIGICA